MTGLPKVGDYVRVPMGTTVVEAEVLYAYDHGAGGRVRVAVPLIGTDEYLTITLTVDVVEPAQAA